MTSTTTLWLQLILRPYTPEVFMIVLLISFSKLEVDVFELSSLQCLQSMCDKM